MMKWTEITSNFPVARSSHKISVIGDTLYMLGGEYEARTPIGSELQALKLTDGLKADWAVVEAKGEIPSARFGHGLCSVGSCLFVFGGRMGTAIDEKLLNDLYKFDIKTSTWSKVACSGSVPCERSFHSMVSNGSSIYVFGGCPAAGRLADLHHLDTETGVWTELPGGDMEGRGGTPLTVAPDGNSLFVVGGFAGREMADIHRFDIASKTWTKEEQGLDQGLSVAVCAAVGDNIVLYGGELEPSARGHSGAGNFSSQTAVFSYQGGLKEVRRGEGPPARGWSDGAVWRGDRLVVVGGLTGDDSNPVRLADVWLGKLDGQ